MTKNCSTCKHCDPVPACASSFADGGCNIHGEIVYDCEDGEEVFVPLPVWDWYTCGEWKEREGE